MSGAGRSKSRWIIPVAVALVAALWFGVDVERTNRSGDSIDEPKSTAPFQFRSGLGAEPYFADEGSYVAQSYYYRLFFEGRRNDPDWLHYAAYDSPPLFKYLIGFSLHRRGFETPRSIVPAERWWSGRFEENNDPRLISAARLPMFVGAVAGVVAAFLLVRKLAGVFSGLVAAALLALSPLYFTHARRAMADDLTQAASLFGLYFAVQLCNRVWNRPSQPMMRPLRLRDWFAVAGLGLSVGLAFGVSSGCKLNGLIAPLALVCFGALWIAPLISFPASPDSASLGFAAAPTVFTKPTPDDQRRSPTGVETPTRPRTSIAVVAVSLVAVAWSAIFFGFNPYFYAQPELPAAGESASINGVPRSPEYVDALKSVGKMNFIERFRHLFDHRRRSLVESAPNFPNDALPTYSARFNAMVRDGLGRWSAFGGPTPAIDRSRRNLNSTKSPINSIRWLIAGGLTTLGLIAATLEGFTQRSADRAPVAWIPAVWWIVESTILFQTLALNWDRYYMGFVVSSTILIALGPGIWMDRIRRAMFIGPLES